ncbi:hypothetical protein GCM10027162_36740 [Streptomyces incanus]
MAAQRRRKQQEETEAERLAAEAERAREQAAEARYRIAVLEAEAATADDWADLTPRQRKARKAARMIGGSAGHVDVVELKEIEAAGMAARSGPVVSAFSACWRSMMCSGVLVQGLARVSGLGAVVVGVRCVVAGGPDHGGLVPDHGPDYRRSQSCAGPVSPLRASPAPRTARGRTCCATRPHGRLRSPGDSNCCAGGCARVLRWVLHQEVALDVAHPPAGLRVCAGHHVVPAWSGC